MPISKHHSKKGSNSDWKARARKFKDAQAVSMMAENLLSVNPNKNSLLRSLSWRKKANDSKAGLVKKFTNLFRRGNR